jgi:hypothetical protein
MVVAKSAKQAEALGYAHATSGNRMACPTRIANPDYRRGFIAGYAA